MRNPYVYIIVVPIMSLVFGLIFYFYIPLYEVTGIMKALDGILLLSSINLGFYGACLGVLASIFNTDIVKKIMGDNNYRREFIIIASLSLATGFITVIVTIIYQVFLESHSLLSGYLGYINSVWIFFVVTFFLYQLLFFVVLFSIFFYNKDINKKETTKDNVHTPKLNGIDH